MSQESEKKSRLQKIDEKDIPKAKKRMESGRQSYRLKPGKSRRILGRIVYNADEKRKKR